MRWENPFIEQASEILHLIQLVHCIPLTGSYELTSISNIFGRPLWNKEVCRNALSCRPNHNFRISPKNIIHRLCPFVGTLYIYFFRMSILTCTYISKRKKKKFIRSNSSSDEHYFMIWVSLYLSPSLFWFPIHFFKNKCKQSTVVYLFSLAPDKRHNS